MSADQQAMIDQLQAALAQGPQASFGGVTAPPDPNALRALLSKLQQQQFLQQQSAPTPGPWGFLHDAGRAQFASVGQQLGNAIGAALGANPLGNPPGQAAQSGPAYTMPAPASATNGSQAAQATDGGDSSSSPGNAAPPVPIPTPGATPQASINNMLAAAKAYNQALIKNGTPADQAKVQTLTQMVTWGVPGADAALETAQAAVLKNAQTQSETAKNTSQAKMDTASIANQADEQKNRAFQQNLDTQKNTWTTVSDTPQTTIQRNGLGEIQVKQKQNAGQAAAANVSPDAMQAMLDSYHTTGVVPTGLARSPAMAGLFWDAEAKYQQQTGNTANSVLAAKASAQANTSALAQTQKQLSQTSSYFDTMDKNIAAASALAKQIDLSDVTLLNKAYSAWAKGTSDPQFAKYNVFFDSVANEYAKIKSGALGNAPVSDAARKEAMGVLYPLMSANGVQAAFDAVKQEGQNRLDSLTAQRDDLVGRLSGKPRPTSPQASPTGTTPTAPTAPRTYNPATGTFQ
jgi:hypothetical protein